MRLAVDCVCNACAHGSWLFRTQYHVSFPRVVIGQICIVIFFIGCLIECHEYIPLPQPLGSYLTVPACAPQRTNPPFKGWSSSSLLKLQHFPESGILLRTIRAYWSKRWGVPPVLFRTNYYSIEILHGVTAIIVTYIHYIAYSYFLGLLFHCGFTGARLWNRSAFLMEWVWERESVSSVNRCINMAARYAMSI